tara:strand:- start:239 stop:1294 length:1056 start_codon:yes stop_codon:yes gene_type:complete
MVSKYIALIEESAAAYGTAVTTPSLDYKMLSEDITVGKEDFFPETTETWAVSNKAEGFFRGGGSFSTLMDPLMFPKLMVLFIGDGGSAGAGGNGTGSGSGHQHVWLFGANEATSATGVKSFTTVVGNGLEKDRQISGGLIESIDIEAINRAPITVTVSTINSGDERLITAYTPTYAGYTDTYSNEQPFMTFANVSTMTVGGSDRLTTAPTIEAFRLSLARGWDSDAYTLGSRFMANALMSGMAEVTGSMDFSFTAPDEHERFMGAVNATQVGDQAAFAIVLTVTGNTIGASGTYTVSFTMSECYYSASVISVNARDRIVDTVQFKALYNATDSAACKITCIADTQAYTSLT